MIDNDQFEDRLEDGVGFPVDELPIPLNITIITPNSF